MLNSIGKWKDKTPWELTVEERRPNSCCISRMLIFLLALNALL